MLWRKESNMKFTDMCIFIDENVKNIANPGENPDLENKIYNYLWLLVKALAIKKCMFNNFQDYDPYAFYAANRLFFALRKNLWNQGKVIKGKEIRPIKSCLNYTKALLYPMKIEYQREAYREIISEEFVSKKFDAFMYKEHLKTEAKEAQGVSINFWNYVKDSFEHISDVIDRVLKKSPFKYDSVEYHRLKVSIMLNSINILKNKKKLDANQQTIILWKLPKSMNNYVRILLKEFFTEIKLEIMDSYKAADIDESVVEKLLQDTGESNTYEDQY